MEGVLSLIFRFFPPVEKLGMRRWRFEKETLTHPAKTFENKVFECTDGLFGKTLQQGGGKAGVVWKTGKAGKKTDKR